MISDKKLSVLFATLDSKFIHSNLAVKYLKKYTDDLPYDCIIKEFSINDRVPKIVQEIVVSKPNIVAFSCYIWNIQYVEEISNLIKLIDSNIEILYGGPEVSYDGSTFLKKNVGEYLIEGEGEETYREFIQCKLNINDISKYSIKGLYLKENEDIFYGGKRELMDMTKIKFPYSKQDIPENKIVYYEASRGCPFNCKYCLSSTIHGVRFQNIERVKKELSFFIDNEVNLVKFVDRTFNCNEKFAMEIWQYLINKDTKCTFHFEISADILSEREIILLEKAPKGRFQFEVGVQTTNNEILKNINRNVNFEDIKEKVEEVKKLKNIKQHLDLIAGLPGEDLLSFKKSFNQVYEIKPEEIQLGFLKLLKGSPMRLEAEKWGMVYSPYPPYEILKTNTMSYEEIMKLKKIEEVLDKYYNSQKFVNILKYFENKFETPYDFYYSLGNYFYNKGYLNRSISSADYYKVFVEFNEEVLMEQNSLLCEIIKYDYLLHNKKKWLPPFLPREIDKTKEKAIVDRLIVEGIETSKENIHIEKFGIDILFFIETGNEIWENSYVIFPSNSQNKKIYKG